MNSLDRRKIRANYVELVRNLNPDDVLDYLYQEAILHEEDCESIRSAPTRAQKVRLFLALLPKKKSGGLEKLITALDQTGYNELVQMLKAPVSEDYPAICDLSPVTAENYMFEDPRILDLREKLEQQSQVVESMQQEMEQLQTELKRHSQSFEGNEKYKRTVTVLNELEVEKAEREKVYNEIYEAILQDINKIDEVAKDKDKDKDSRGSRSSTLTRSNVPHRQSSFRTPSIGISNIGHRQFAKIKCVLVGDGGTGKTSIIHYFIHKQRQQSYVPTVFDNRCVTLSNGTTLVTVNFWDTAGQEGYDRLRPLSYADSNVAVLVFSVTSQTSLNNVLAKWYPEFRHYCKKTPVILVGNKTDPIEDHKEFQQMRRDGHRLVEAKEAEKAAQVIKANSSKSYFCSALTGDGIEKLLEQLTTVGLKNLYKQRKKPKGCTMM